MLVECINDKSFEDPLGLINEFPKKGEVYTVIQRNHTKGYGLGYVLEELNNSLLPNGEPVGFSAKRFKPISDIDISELTDVLEKEHQQ